MILGLGGGKSGLLVRTGVLSDKVSRKTILINLGLLAFSCLIMLPAVELLLRPRYTEGGRPPSRAVLSIQQYVELDSELGFKWEPNVSAADNIVFEISDAVHVPHSTDADGFINEPDAIAGRAAGEPVDIVGLGDSFVEHASRTFYEYFQSQGLSYYNLAMQRQAPPQHNINLESRALALEPKWIVYGIFENDFAEAKDFENWKQSGIDWFYFHSGTWCGTSLPVTRTERIRQQYVPGFSGLMSRVRVRFRGERMSLAGPSAEEISLVSSSTQEAAKLAQDAGVKLLVVFIPSRPSAISGDTLESEGYDLVIESLKHTNARTLDLRAPFQQHDDPASLYYTIDGHWNAKGMQYAAELILDSFASSDS